MIALRPYVLSLLRIVAGFTFSLHGLALLFGIFGGTSGHGGRATAFTLLWFAGALELAGGFLVLIGLYTRFAAIILSGQMAVAYFTVHAPHGPLPLQNGGELAVLYCFIFLYVAVAGAGPLSMDKAARGTSV